MSQQDAQNTAMPEKMELTSLNIADHQKQKLKELFPEVFTEGNKIDFDQLKRTLGEMVDGGKERFGMQWAGKADCFKTIQQPSLATLVPCPEESIDFDTTENVFIEGDNLEVLKLLQKGYLGKVKMIYIDPPYNTGKDFIYPDNYSENLDTYLEYTGQIDGEGRKFSTNTDTDGRFHSKWMNMMYPRLFLAKNLLREDGVMFISIDDSEIKNLRAICDEIFGEENAITSIIWEKKFSPQNDEKHITAAHDYILVYARNKEIWRPNLLDRSEKALDKFKNPDNDHRGVWTSGDLTSKTKAANHSYPIHSPSGKIFYPPNGRQWAPSIETFNRLISENRIWFGEDGKNTPRLKQFLSEIQSGVVPMSIFKHQEVGHTQYATQELKKIFEGVSVFDNPKPTPLISKIVKMASDKNSIVLDFFAGSSTTAHAVMSLNSEDGGSRKYICVQLPETINEKDEAFKAGFKKISEVSKKRIYLSSNQIKQDLIKFINDAKSEMLQFKLDLTRFNNDLLSTLDGKEEYEEAQAKVTAQEELIREKELLLEKLDLGFRVFKLQKSNFSVWDSSFTTNAEQIAFQLDQHVDHISPEAEQQAILFELLLKAGFELTTPIDTLILADKTVYSIAEGALLICLEKQLTLEVMHAIADLEPSRVIVLDEGFQNNDQLKTNASLTLKSKGILDFRTV